MKINEIITEQLIGELATEDHRREMVIQLGKIGYKQIGAGAEAMVFKKDTSHVIKMLFPMGKLKPVEAKSMGLAIQSFFTFYNFCKKNPSICLPKFNDVNEVEINGETLYQIDMEHLYPLKNGGIGEAIVFLVGEHLDEDSNWEDKFNMIFNPDEWGSYLQYHGDASSFSDPHQIIEAANKLPQKMLQEFCKIMVIAYNAGITAGESWDLHTENVMQRKNGTLVITDPFISASQ